MLKKVDKELLAKEEAQARQTYPSPDVPTIEPLLPDAIAVASENAGIKKAKKDLTTQFMLAMLGGGK